MNASSTLTMAGRFKADLLTPEDTETILPILLDWELRAEAKAARHDLYALQRLFFYTAYCTSCFDGDTITVDIDKGFGETEPEVKLRLYGINAPELYSGTAKSKKKGKEVGEFVRRRTEHKTILIRTHKGRGDDFRPRSGKFGRLLTEVFAFNDSGSLFNLNKYLVDQGMAEFETYGDKNFPGFTEL